MLGCFGWYECSKSGVVVEYVWIVVVEVLSWIKSLTPLTQLERARGYVIAGGEGDVYIATCYVILISHHHDLPGQTIGIAEAAYDQMRAVTVQHLAITSHHSLVASIYRSIHLASQTRWHPCSWTLPPADPSTISNSSAAG